MEEVVVVFALDERSPGEIIHDITLIIFISFKLGGRELKNGDNEVRQASTSASYSGSSSGPGG